MLFGFINSYGQVSVAINNMSEPTTGTIITTGTPIVIVDNESKRIAFTIQLEKPYSQVVDGYLYIYTKAGSGSTPQSIGGSEYIVNSAWSGSSGTVYIDRSKDITLYASSFSASGGILFAQFESASGGVSYKSNEWAVAIESSPIIKNTISGNQTIATGQTPSPIIGSTPEGGDGSYSYNWEKKTGSAWSSITGADEKNLTLGSLTTTTSYRRVVNSGSTTSSTSNVVTITVNLQSIANNTISGNQTIDEGSSPSTLVGSTPTGGNGSYSYSWEYKTTGNWQTVDNASSQNYSPESLITTTRYRRTVESAGATNTSNTVTINVINYPKITNNTIAFDGTSEVIGSVPSGGNGSYLFQYYIISDFEGIEHWSSWTTNPNFTIPAFFLQLSLQHGVGVRRIVKSVNKTSWSEMILIEPPVPDIINNTISRNGVHGVSGSTPEGGIGIYAYSWEYWVSPMEDYPAPIPNQTGENLTLTNQLKNLNPSLDPQVRRIVNSGSKESKSNWISIAMPEISNNTIIRSGNEQITGSLPHGGIGSYTYAWEFAAVEIEPYVLQGFTAKNLFIPENIRFIPIELQPSVRRIVKSGAQTSTSAWVSIAMPEISNNTIQYIGNGVVNGNSPAGGNGQYSYQWEFAAYEVGPDPVGGQTSKNLTVPQNLRNFPPFFEPSVRRIVTSGTYVSYSPWELINTDLTSARIIDEKSKLTLTEEITKPDDAFIYPNPSEGIVYFDVPGTQALKILVTPLSGGNPMEIFNGTLDSSYAWKIPNEYAKGIYLYQIIGDEININGRLIYK